MADFNDLLWPDGEDNMGGIQIDCYYIPLVDLQVFPSLPANPATLEDECVLEGNFVPKAGKGFFKLYCTLETGFLSDENQGERDGQSFVHNAEIFFPGTKKRALGFARRVNNSNMVFLVKEADVDGKFRVIGSEEFPAKCTPNLATGTATADRKGMTLSIQTYGNTPAPIYEGVIPLVNPESGSGA